MRPGRFGHEEVILTLPKFRMTVQYALVKPLAAMGLTDAFTFGAADFSGMDGKKDLFISTADRTKPSWM